MLSEQPLEKNQSKSKIVSFVTLVTAVAGYS